MLSRNHLCIVGLHICAILHANNIQVSNVQLVGQNTANHTYQVQFDLSWENSWRTSTLESNWDAAWVFIKCSKLDFNDWKHARLNLAGSAAPSGATVQVVDNSDNPAVGVGAFIYRSADGIGNITFTGVQLQWDYSAAGYTDNDLMEVCVQAIEMVYVPQGQFFLGDGGEDNAAGFEAGATGSPFLVTSENTAIALGGGGTGSLGNNNHNGQTLSIADDFNDATTQSLPASYPLGYHAFYCMKYEISQGQYAEFLSKLTIDQAAARFLNQNGNFQNTIFKDGNRYYATVPSRACNYLTWGDCKGYLDWSALRPMSETEYEKVCRGSRYAVVDEYAWGNACVTEQGYSLTDAGSESTTVTQVVLDCGNAWYSNTSPTNGPVRCGAFAANPSADTRETSGASYYGALELSGNVTEFVVGLGLPLGRSFDGRHGDGALSSTGAADVVNWPASAANSGHGHRGGSWSYVASTLRVSARLFSNSWVTARSGEIGGRGVRTAP